MAILKMMGIKETIAASKDDYVKIAVRLGCAPQYRQHISRQVAANQHKLYGDMEPLRALENFLLNVVPKERNTATVSEALQFPSQPNRVNRLAQAEQAYLN